MNDMASSSAVPHKKKNLSHLTFLLAEIIKTARHAMHTKLALEDYVQTADSLAAGWVTKVVKPGHPHPQNQAAQSPERFKNPGGGFTSFCQKKFI